MTDFDKYISDEMLAAYIDGNAIPIERNIIGNYCGNEDLQEVLDIVSDIEDNPELLEVGEDLQAEIPDKMFEGIEKPLQNLQELRTELEIKNNKII